VLIMPSGDTRPIFRAAAGGLLHGTRNCFGAKLDRTTYVPSTNKVLSTPLRRHASGRRYLEDHRRCPEPRLLNRGPVAESSPRVADIGVVHIFLPSSFRRSCHDRKSFRSQQ
jgi:hypothetical protein